MGAQVLTCCCASIISIQTLSFLSFGKKHFLTVCILSAQISVMLMMMISFHPSAQARSLEGKLFRSEPTKTQVTPTRTRTQVIRIRTDYDPPYYQVVDYLTPSLSNCTVIDHRHKTSRVQG